MPRPLLQQVRLARYHTSPLTDRCSGPLTGSVWLLSCRLLVLCRELLISILRDRLSVARALNVEVTGLEQAPEAYKRFSSGPM